MYIENYPYIYENHDALLEDNQTTTLKVYIYLSTLLLFLSIVVVSVVAVAVVALIAILIINKKSNLNVSGKFRHVMMFSTISSPSMYI